MNVRNGVWNGKRRKKTAVMTMCEITKLFESAELYLNKYDAHTKF